MQRKKPQAVPACSLEPRAQPRGLPRRFRSSSPASCAPTSRYSRLSIALHWLMVLLLAATAITMEVRGMYPKGSEAREWIKSVHYVLGLSVLALVWLRLLARFHSQTPPIQPTPATWQTGLSHAAHAVAGLAHHYLWRDNTLLRMLPGKS